MPPRSRRAADSLSPADLTALANAVADGKRATVYLCEGTPSLGLAAGASARVVSVSGSTVTVRPRGVDDELPYEADELRMTRESAAKPTARRTAPSAIASVRTATPANSVPAKAVPANEVPANEVPATPKSSPRPKPSPKPAGKPPRSVTVTIFGSTDNQWSVAVTHGGRKPGQSHTVTPDSVEGALRELGDETAVAAASAVLDAAREEAVRRVEDLSRELAAAQEALAALAPK